MGHLLTTARVPFPTVALHTPRTGQYTASCFTSSSASLLVFLRFFRSIDNLGGGSSNSQSGQPRRSHTPRMDKTDVQVSQQQSLSSRNRFDSTHAHFHSNIPHRNTMGDHRRRSTLYQQCIVPARDQSKDVCRREDRWWNQSHRTAAQPLADAR